MFSLEILRIICEVKKFKIFNKRIPRNTVKLPSPSNVVSDVLEYASFATIRQFLLFRFQL